MTTNVEKSFSEKLKLQGAWRQVNFSCKWQHVYTKNKIKCKTFNNQSCQKREKDNSSIADF